MPNSSCPNADSYCEPKGEGEVYQGYAYTYPHKTAYRGFDPPLDMAEIWAEEPKDSLFLYIHIPFCSARCGYCNLFSLPGPTPEKVDAYLMAVGRQAVAVRDSLGDARFARMAVGGGTPSLLTEENLHRLFDIAEETMGLDASRTPISFEISPSQIDRGRLSVLQARGVNRVSIGVQSFLGEELDRLGRRSSPHEAQKALNGVRSLGFETLNIDLIYGIPGQTLSTWLFSLEKALSCRPEEIYLYPLYIRSLTALHRNGVSPSSLRLEMYRLARDLLLTEGYRQSSMRLFQRSKTRNDGGPVYCCQEDGMVGLGCGPRSYTRHIHYSSEYAVSAKPTRAIIQEFIDRSDACRRQATHGIILDTDERKRRFVIKSILKCEGLSRIRYHEIFQSEPQEDAPYLTELIDRNLAESMGDVIRLTDAGIELSDLIGPRLYSPVVKERMEAYRWR